LDPEPLRRVRDLLRPFEFVICFDLLRPVRDRLRPDWERDRELLPRDSDLLLLELG
jgi:hypothetical protein